MNPKKKGGGLDTLILLDRAWFQRRLLKEAASAHTRIANASAELAYIAVKMGKRSKDVDKAVREIKLQADAILGYLRWNE